MKVLSGHLTSTDKKAIRLMWAAKILSARVGKSFYHITETNGIFTVKKQIKDRGMIPCPGSELRLSTYISTFTN